jgi:hemolysin activation/secretion protein
VLNLNRLVDELRLLQVNPLIGKINANLSASSTPGLSNLQVSVLSAPSLEAAAAMDNGRNPQIGSFRRGVDLGDANVFGYGDGFSLSYRNSDGSNDLLTSYKIPLSSSDLTLTLTNRIFDSWIIEESLKRLNIHSHYQQWFVGLRQPLIRRVEEEFALGLSLNKQDNKGLFLDGLPYPGRGVDPNGESRVVTLSFSQDWTKRSNSQVFALRSEVGIGLGGLDTTIPADYPADPNSPDPNFLFWRADTQYVRQLAANTLLVARGRAQLADGPLPSVEQFGLGGLGSVEGYQTNTLLSDNGLFASLELAVPIASWMKGQNTLQLVPFTAIGYGWNSSKIAVNTPNIDVLGSVGLGLQLRMGSNFYGRLDFAQRLGPVPYQATNIWQDQAVLFSLRYGF